MTKLTKETIRIMGALVGSYGCTNDEVPGQPGFQDDHFLVLQRPHDGDQIVSAFAPTDLSQIFDTNGRLIPCWLFKIENIQQARPPGGYPTKLRRIFYNVAVKGDNADAAVKAFDDYLRNSGDSSRVVCHFNIREE